jgi:hypothetical protein
VLKISRSFNKHRICHLQGEYLSVGLLAVLCRQAVGGELDVMEMITGAKELVAI